MLYNILSQITNKKTIWTALIWIIGAILGYTSGIYNINAYCENHESGEEVKTEQDIWLTVLEIAIIMAAISIAWHLYGMQMITYPLHYQEAKLACNQLKRSLYRLNQEELIELKIKLKQMIAEIREQ